MARLVLFSRFVLIISAKRVSTVIAYVFIFLRTISLRVFVNKHKEGYNNDVALVWRCGAFYKESVPEQKRKCNGVEAN